MPVMRSETRAASPSRRTGQASNRFQSGIKRGRLRRIEPAANRREIRALRFWTVTVAAMLFVQLALGASMRHSQKSPRKIMLF